MRAQYEIDLMRDAEFFFTMAIQRVAKLRDAERWSDFDDAINKAQLARSIVRERRKKLMTV